MSTGLNRRDVLKYTGAAAAGLFASPLLRWAGAQDAAPKKILFFTRSAGYQHSAITRPRNKPHTLSFAENFMVNLGKKHNFEVTCTKDGGIFTEQGLEPFDVIMFFTTGLLDQPLPPLSRNGEINNHPMPPGGKDLFLKLIADGKKGFLGVHSATDTFHGPNGTVDPYIRMIGGEFVHHFNQQEAKIISVDPDWPPTKGLQTFTKKEEWYILNHLADNLHVLLVQDTASMEQEQYKKLPSYPETWAHYHNKGKVFYTSMGHREDVWRSPQFHKVLLGGLNWVSGNIEAQAEPNVHKVTPNAPILPAGPA